MHDEKNKMIKAIIFDLGGVLITLDKARCIRAFQEKAGFARIEEFLDTCHQRGMIGEIEAGAIDEATFYARCLQYCAPGTTAETVRDCMHALLNPVQPEIVALLQQLQKRYDLYILTNNSSVTMTRTRADAFQAGLDFDRVFKRVFVSQDLKMLKPSREIFDYVIARTSLRPDELLYVDDSPRNVEAARAAGMNAVHHDPATDLAQTLAAYR